MFSHRSYLILDSHDDTDIMSLTKNGHELADFEFSFQQGIDDTGKAVTRVYGGTISIVLPTIPADPIIEWAMDSRQYKIGTIVVLGRDDEAAISKIRFTNATCIHMNLSYAKQGKSYSTTHLTIQAEELLFGEDLDFNNEWTK